MWEDEVPVIKIGVLTLHFRQTNLVTESAIISEQAWLILKNSTHNVLNKKGSGLGKSTSSYQLWTTQAFSKYSAEGLIWYFHLRLMNSVLSFQINGEFERKN